MYVQLICALRSFIFDSTHTLSLFISQPLDAVTDVSQSVEIVHLYMYPHSLGFHFISFSVRIFAIC